MLQLLMQDVKKMEELRETNYISFRFLSTNQAYFIMLTCYF